MHIKFVEIQNFRKLKSCHVDFEKETTVFVGANNSGKTSAMHALDKFLTGNTRFSMRDFTISNWLGINSIGETWSSESGVQNPTSREWSPLLPALDIWLQVESDEIHHVTNLIPTLDWPGGSLGVRLRFEPKAIAELYADFRAARKAATETIIAAQSANGAESISLKLWPKDLSEFLDKNLNTYFTVRTYTLDPQKCTLPVKGLACPQEITVDDECIEENPLKRLIRVDNIYAQRGFCDPDNMVGSTDDDELNTGKSGMLSTQLRTYYNRHLNPEELPDPQDIKALQAIENAQDSFDERLHEGFKKALAELGSLGYPGFADPQITISTRIKPMDGLDHNSAVQFELMSNGAATTGAKLRLPEQYNGLGYQNLISMVFKLMQYRDRWMQVGKQSKKTKDDYFFEPLHLVLVEEPEAHLHVQVQQVFIRKAYEILRKHENLGKNKGLRTQLVVSSHSGHIAHEMKFSCLRYFRRKPAITVGEVPNSLVVNLSEVFGTEDATNQFVSRYLSATHCDLFFADAAIFVEGPAERMLVPHFIRHHFEKLNESYISLLEIGGSHVHRFRPLIEHLGLTSLIITDLDSANPAQNSKAMQPRRNQGYKTGNSTLKTWIPCKESIDDLLDLADSEKVKTENSFLIRVAYQCPISVKLEGKAAAEEALPNTFEDALVFDNLAIFKSMAGTGLIKKFRDAINAYTDVVDIGAAFFNELKDAKKAEFALELLYLQDPDTLKVPTYIHEGLSWLQEQLQKIQDDIFEQTEQPEAAVETEVVKC